MRTRYRAALVAAAYLAFSPLGLHAQGRTEQDIVELIVRESPQAKAIRAVAESVTADRRRDRRSPIQQSATLTKALG